MKLKFGPFCSCPFSDSVRKPKTIVHGFDYVHCQYPASLLLQDFSSIFTTLLPGACAKLAPLEGRSVLEGVEVRIGFGGVWKESLQELSGGQRSVGVENESMFD